MEDNIELVGAMVSVVVAAFFYAIITQNVFPAFKYAIPDETLINVTHPIGREVSGFIWDKRGIDLMAQAFAMFAAAAGCLAILREEKGG